MLYRGFLVMLGWLAVAVKVFPQPNPYAFSRLNISNGLSNNQANCFYKDKQGFLWIGTMAGLNRYDGYGFKIFYHNINDTTSLSDDFIIRILEGPDDKMWLETRNGFNVFDPGTEKISRNIGASLQSEGIPENVLIDLKKDPDGNYWFLTGRQTLYRRKADSKKSDIVYKNLFQQNQIAAFAFNKKRQCVIIHVNGLVTVLDSKSGKQVRTSNIPTTIFGAGSLFYSLFIDDEDELWIYASADITPKGLLRMNLASDKYILYAKDKGDIRLNTNLVISIQQDNQGKFWICTDHGGINLFDKKKNSIQYLLHNDDEIKSLSQNSITAAYKDNSGIIWLGTYKQGVSYYHESIIKFPLYRKRVSDPNSLPFDDVNRFVEDAKGNLWIGTNGGGLIYFDRAANRFTQYKHQPGNANSISNNVIVSLLIDHEQKLWIGSYYGGLDCYVNGRFIHYKNDPNDPYSLSDDRVWEIYEDSKNNLWVGTLNGGLNRFDRTKNIFYRMNANQPNLLSGNYISALTEDQQNRLWVGTSNGIDVIDAKNNITHYNIYNDPATRITNNNINCFLRDSRGLMWIGTRDGLNVFDPSTKTFYYFRNQDGLPGNNVLNILEDEQHHLWISTNNGIANITVGTGQQGITIKPVNYDELDGLQGTEFNENAALKTSKGEMIFGGANGFNLFFPSTIKADQVSSIVALTDLQLFNKTVVIGEEINGRTILSQSISEAKSIELRHNENILALEFAALSFFNPEKIKYAYKLEGFNDNWIYTDGNMRKAIYTNLDPGTYTFRVKASEEDGSWNEKETTLTIKISPPFWKTPLAYLLYAAVIVFALWAARRILLERARMRFEVEQQRKEAERVQQMDALKTKFFTNVSHEFRTPLSLILSPLEKIIKKAGDTDQKKQLQLVQRNAKRLLNLVNQLLDFRKMEVQEFSIHLTKEDIVNFCRDMTYSFSDISEKKDISLSFSTNVDLLETYFDKDKLEKILFNLLSNAFKYTPSGGKVSVELEYDPNRLNNGAVQLKVKDSGIGIANDMKEKIFERFYQLNTAGGVQNSGSGIGLVITKEFVKLHGGTIEVESEPEKGSCFIVTLPVKDIQEPAMLQEKKEETVLSPQVTDELLNGTGENGHAKRNTILLVEDNEDFRFYLKDNLKQNYQVIEAVNGKEGWDKARDIQPDLVVSDVMMPVMNGIELSKKVKTDPRTSHIPMILLTAMNSEETELEGFKAGINDYISKPFTFEILASRIRNMLRLKEQLRNRFQNQVEVNPADVTVSPVDEEFMKQALAAVEKNMDNPDFSVEDLSRELFMSRVALYKKLLSLTGKTPIEFIRVMRLKRAAQLLQKSDLNISEIAYQVGYNNPKIFTKYFKEEFSMTPSQYQANKS